jgi:HlyD family secretion protein
MEVKVTATGNLAPTNEVSVGSELSGLIDTVHVDVNDRVNRGQTLAQIDTVRLRDSIRRSESSLASAKASVQQAEATLALTRATLNRQEEVFRISDGKVPARTELDAARAEYQRAQANVAVTKANVRSAEAQLSTENNNLSKATIRSPVTGVILSRQIEPGQTVAASFNTPTLFRIAEDLAKMELEVKIDEADVGQVKPGQQASFTVDAWPGRTFPAVIQRVNVGSNVATTGAAASSVVNYGAVLGVENPELILRPGMTATATIISSQEKNVLLAPNGALRFKPKQAGGAQGGFRIGVGPPGQNSVQEVTLDRGARQTIHVLEKDGKLTPHQVVTGSSDGAVTIVTGKTLKPGMEIVTGERSKLPK